MTRHRRGRRRRRIAHRALLPAATTVAGLTLVVVATAALARDRVMPRDVGATAPPARSPTSAVASPSLRQAHDDSARPASHPASLPDSKPVSQPASLPAPDPAADTAAPTSAPVTLTIPSQRVAASVVPVDVDGSVLGVPDDPSVVGWWTAGASPGAAAGSVVIDGHVDSATTVGALFRLGDLRIGDRIVVTTANGLRYAYSVTGRRVYSKQNALPPGLFSRDGPQRLVVITCGGPFDRAQGSYRDNVVVFAAPV